MSKFLQGIRATFFWSYDRGSWPYDVMVVLIVIFVLITPRNWFHDQPQNNFSSPAGVELLTQDPITHIEIYRLDCGLFGKIQPSAKSDAQMEEKTHQILTDSVESLRGQKFQVRSIEPIHGDDGALLYYRVEVKH